jgi:predicted AlkP superfamily pyrophosphatase or phosphodiesterase
MQRTVVLNVVGLTEALIGEHTPAIAAFRDRGSLRHIDPSFPALTCTAQSNYVTGKTPAKHGIVANGWFNRELSEVHFWKQSNHVVTAPKLWDELRSFDPQFTCATLFWWYNMYASVDYSITPRPMYPADGRKFFDIYSWPADIRPEIKKELGEFPFAGFWGPAAGVRSPQGEPDCVTRWIAESAKWTERKYQPTLSLVYLPHLDYNLQRHGTYRTTPDPGSRIPENSGSAPTSIGHPESGIGNQVSGISHQSSAPGHPSLNPAIFPDLRAIDAIVGDLIQFFEQCGVSVILLSEYGITNVSQPIHLNRLFRERGWITVKEELGLEILDAGNSQVFAVADHQVAHVYLNERIDPRIRHEVRALLEGTDGIARVLDGETKKAAGIDHERAGDFIAVAREDAWFTYYYWLSDKKAPDFARCVDIHRKPGYDPVELFLDPRIPAPKLKIAWRLLQKKLGFRMLMDLIPLDASLVKGSHGCRPASQADWPVMISAAPKGGGAPMNSSEVYGAIKHVVLAA